MLADSRCCGQSRATVSGRPGWSGDRRCQDGHDRPRRRLDRVALGAARRRLRPRRGERAQVAEGEIGWGRRRSCRSRSRAYVRGRGRRAAGPGPGTWAASSSPPSRSCAASSSGRPTSATRRWSSELALARSVPRRRTRGSPRPTRRSSGRSARRASSRAARRRDALDRRRDLPGRHSATRSPTRTCSASRPAPASARRSRSSTARAAPGATTCSRSRRSSAARSAVALAYVVGRAAGGTGRAAALVLAGVTVACVPHGDSDVRPAAARRHAPGRLLVDPRQPRHGRLARRAAARCRTRRSASSYPAPAPPRARRARARRRGGRGARGQRRPHAAAARRGRDARDGRGGRGQRADRLRRHHRPALRCGSSPAASYRIVLPLSLLVGGGFLVLADIVARTVLSPAELPIGVVTAFFGAPFFAIVLRTSRGRDRMTRGLRRRLGHARRRRGRSAASPAASSRASG